jgi:1-acyl-sn-glycerol-3-phosphate acyltransferase
MRLIKSIFAPIWKLWFALWFVMPFLLLFPLFYVALRMRKYDFVFHLKRLWSRCISYGSLLFPKIEYRGKIRDLPKPCVVAGNHTSYLDIVYCPLYIRHTAIFMGKSELLKIPLFNVFFKYIDIPVNRKKISDAHRAFTDAGNWIDKGYSQVIYPEGTISSFGKLKPFKNGAFKLAIEKQVPIVPVANLNNWWFLQNGGFFKSNGRPGRPRIVVGSPISTKGLTDKDVETLKTKVYTFIAEELHAFYGKQN